MNWEQAIAMLHNATSNYKLSTAKSYNLYIKNLRAFSEKPLHKMKLEDYQAYANNSPSPATQNQKVSAIVFFHTHVLNKHIQLEQWQRPESVYTKKINSKVNRMITKLDSTTKAAVCLAYGNGLKINELAGLKRKNINKTRIILPRRTIPTNQKYWRYVEYTMSNSCNEFVFGSEELQRYGKRAHINHTTLQKGIREYGINFIELRHAFAMNCIKNGALPSELQYIMGLQHIESTYKYYKHKLPIKPRQDYINV